MTDETTAFIDNQTGEVLERGHVKRTEREQRAAEAANL